MTRASRRYRLLMPAVLTAGTLVIVWAGSGAPRRQFVTYSADELARVSNVHRHRGGPVCQACHVDDTRELVAPMPNLCFRCHSESEHPSADRGSRPCTDCHAVHEVGSP